MKSTKHFSNAITIMGPIKNIDAGLKEFTIECRSMGQINILVGEETNFLVLQNLDNLQRDRIQPIDEPIIESASDRIRKYIQINRLIVVECVEQVHEATIAYNAKTIHVLHSGTGHLLFEETHWWLTQISVMANEWLDDLFGDKRDYLSDDFAKLYKTNLNILGLPTDDNIQECATLSRLIYGLSSAFLLTGNLRYYRAARAGTLYQRETFRTLSHDGNLCIWAFGKRKLKYGSKIIMPSENPDDCDAIPLYEQIYALAGLTQYYRISSDWAVLMDINRTINAFYEFYHDPTNKGFYSHIDYATMTVDSDVLRSNKKRKNWNSVGDHIPAYLVNLILALDRSVDRTEGLDSQMIDTQEVLLKKCKSILEETSQLILSKFSPDDSPFVHERFYEDWKPDYHWGWQQNRAICGHDLKIVWNLIRVANYYTLEATKQPNPERSQPLEEKSKEFLMYAKNLANQMIPLAIDQTRSGVYDCVERVLDTNGNIKFVWGNTKDFWQQEQGILAYLILFGRTKDVTYLTCARELMAFWNLFFLDHGNNGVFFRVNNNGLPITSGVYGDKASHAVAGYHSFELNYLAQIYLRAYVDGPNLANTFSLNFYLEKSCKVSSLNVLPDFLDPADVYIANYTINGVPYAPLSRESYEIPITANAAADRHIVVVFKKK